MKNSGISRKSFEILSNTLAFGELNLIDEMPTRKLRREGFGLSSFSEWTGVSWEFVRVFTNITEYEW